MKRIFIILIRKSLNYSQILIFIDSLDSTIFNYITMISVSGKFDVCMFAFYAQLNFMESKKKTQFLITIFIQSLVLMMKLAY